VRSSLPDSGVSVRLLSALRFGRGSEVGAMACASSGRSPIFRRSACRPSASIARRGQRPRQRGGRAASQAGDGVAVDFDGAMA
jgi:hypothetical protein